MGNDAVDNFLLFVFRNIIDVLSLVQLRLTAAITLGPIKYHVNVYLVTTAREFICRSEGAMQIHLDLWWSLMVSACSHFCNGVVLVTSVTL